MKQEYRLPSKGIKIVARRFPYLQDELNRLAMRDMEFRQLCHDYEDLARALEGKAVEKNGHSEELHTLKSLEVEILEQVSRSLEQRST